MRKRRHQEAPNYWPKPTIVNQIFCFRSLKMVFRCISERLSVIIFCFLWWSMKANECNKFRRPSSYKMVWRSRCYERRQFLLIKGLNPWGLGIILRFLPNHMCQSKGMALLLLLALSSIWAILESLIHTLWGVYVFFFLLNHWA